MQKVNIVLGGFLAVAMFLFAIGFIGLGDKKPRERMTKTRYWVSLICFVTSGTIAFFTVPLFFLEMGTGQIAYLTGLLGAIGTTWFARWYIKSEIVGEDKRKALEEWSAANAFLLDSLPKHVDADTYVASVMGSIKHHLPKSVFDHISNLLRQWYGERMQHTAGYFREQAAAVDTLVQPLSPDYLRGEMEQSAERVRFARNSGLDDPSYFAGLLNQIFYHLPKSAMVMEGSSPIRSFIPDEELQTYSQRLWAADPTKGLSEILDLTIGIKIPEEVRNQHTQIVSRSGHGKTTALEYMIAKDMEHPDRSVIVIDSQGQMIPRLMALDTIPESRYCILDASDVTHPLALNPFAIAQARLSRQSPKDRAQLINTILELYEWMFSSIMEGSELTGKQGGLFTYACRLLINVPGATMMDMVYLLRNGTGPYQQYISELPQTAQTFFKTEFNDKEYARTKGEVLRRLFQLLQNETFANMFLQKENRVDLVEEMAQNKLILVNTSLAHLRETGSRVFGRFIIALVQLASEERALVRNTDRAYLYIDEFQEYISGNIARLLEQARKSNLGLILAHQGLYQLQDSQVAGAIRTNTAIKMVGSLDPAEEATMAKSMRAEPDQLRQPVGTFFTSVAGVGKAPIVIPNNYLGTLPQRSRVEVGELIASNRAKYSGAPSEYSEPESPDEDDDDRSTSL